MNKRTQFDTTMFGPHDRLTFTPDAARVACATIVFHLNSTIPVITFCVPNIDTGGRSYSTYYIYPDDARHVDTPQYLDAMERAKKFLLANDLSPRQ